MDVFQRAIGIACAELGDEDSTTLRRAAMRTANAFSQLRAFLLRDEMIVKLQTNSTPALPSLSEDSASVLLKELDVIVVELEKGVLDPLEHALSLQDLEVLKRIIGQIWGWMVCDLQDPLWRTYPHLAPQHD